SRAKVRSALASRAWALRYAASYVVGSIRKSSVPLATSVPSAYGRGAMTPVTCERTSTEREAAACPTYSLRAATVSGTTVSTDTSGAGGAAGATAGRRRAAAAPTRSTETATAAVHRTDLIKRFISVPVG